MFNTCCCGRRCRTRSSVQTKPLAPYRHRASALQAFVVAVPVPRSVGTMLLLLLLLLLFLCVSFTTWNTPPPRSGFISPTNPFTFVPFRCHCTTRVCARESTYNSRFFLKPHVTTLAAWLPHRNIRINRLDKNVLTSLP